VLSYTCFFPIRFHVYPICYMNKCATSPDSDVYLYVIIRHLLDPIFVIFSVFIRGQETGMYLRRAFLQWGCPQKPWCSLYCRVDALNLFVHISSTSEYLCHMSQHDGSIRPYSRISRLESLLFLSSSSSIVLTRLSGPRSRPTIFQRIRYHRESNSDHKTTEAATFTFTNSISVIRTVQICGRKYRPVIPRACQHSILQSLGLGRRACYTSRDVACQ
jgi:hypothetical protein